MKSKLLLVLIVLLAGVLRFYQLGSNPPSLDWDEVSLAYNAKAILETGKDEYGNFLPITIRSFNDYKPSLYVYTLVPFFALFGQSETAIRLPSAIAGTLTVLVAYFLVLELFATRHKLALFSSGLLAISPWHSHISRIAFEANLALFFFIFTIFALLKSRRQTWWLPISALAFSLSLLAYHSTKIVAPLLILVILWPHRRRLISNRRAFILASFFIVISAALILRTVQLGIGQARLQSVSFMTIDNLLDKTRHRIATENFSFLTRLINHRYLVFSREIIGGYLDHYNLNFWFIKGDAIPRLTYVNQQGLMYFWELPFLIIGFLSLFRFRPESNKIIAAWFLLAPLASALTSGTPNAVRAIFFLPTFQIFTAFGIVQALHWLKQHRLGLLAIGYTLFAVINIAVYFHNYQIHAPRENSSHWQYGYKQTVEWVMAHRSDYRRVLITTAYDQPYIYVLWYGDYSPKKKTNTGIFSTSFDNFEFRQISWPEDKQLENTLIIASPNEIKEPVTPLWSINFLDNSPAFIAVDSDQI